MKSAAEMYASFGRAGFLSPAVWTAQPSGTPVVGSVRHRRPSSEPLGDGTVIVTEPTGSSRRRSSRASRRAIASTSAPRPSACAHFVGQAGVYFNDAALIASAKRYFKEWVMFGVWGDGVQSEWQRNEGSSAPKQGLVYGTHNITGALEVAARTAAMGDRELADFSTTYGIWGTESATPKTIWTAFDHYLLITQGGRKYVSPDGRRINWWSGETGRSCHWQYCVHAAAQLGRGDRFSTVR